MTDRVCACSDDGPGVRADSSEHLPSEAAVAFVHEQRLVRLVRTDAQTDRKK